MELHSKKTLLVGMELAFYMNRIAHLHLIQAASQFSHSHPGWSYSFESYHLSKIVIACFYGMNDFIPTRTEA